MDKIDQFFPLKLAQKSCFFLLHIPACFANIDGSVSFFAIRLRMQIFFLNDVVVQLILEFKNIFGKCQPVYPKNP